MNKLKKSVMVKMLAWVLCTVSVMGTLMFLALTIIGIDESLYDRTREEAMKSVYESENAVYSMSAFRNRGNSSYAKMLAANCFKFGIIKSDSLKDVNFNETLSYTETNMTEEEIEALDREELFLYQVIADSNGSFDGFFRGYYGEYLDMVAADTSTMTESTEWVNLYADRVCYDVAEGILCYRADGNYYPVQNVSIRYFGGASPTVYNYSYNFEQGGYRLNYKSPYAGSDFDDEEGSEAGAYEVREAIPEEEINRIEGILGGSGTGSMVSLAELNATSFNYNNWGTVILDNIRYIDGSELTLIDSTNFPEGYFIEEPGYYLNENYTLVVEKKVTGEKYWVVSLVPDTVPKELTDSRYNNYSRILDIYYDFDDILLQGLGISILLTFVSLFFLAYAAGHRRNQEGIVLTFVDRIPLEVLTVIAGAVEFAALFLCMLTLERAYISISLIGITVFLMAVVGIWYLLSLCVRFKSGKWWRNSICYRIYSRVRDTVLKVFQNIGLLWKLILIMGAVSVLEFLALIDFHRDFMVICWLAEKLVVCAVVLILAIQMHELQKASRQMAEGDLAYKVNTAKMFWECRKHGENLNRIGEGMSRAVEERMKSERFKTELITNVSHDIKTPLTSIINYVDLLEKEELHNEKAVEYLEVLDRQSSKLKKLIEDLVEASKASSGNLPVNSESMEVGVFLTQTVGEFEEKLSLAGLELIVNKVEEPVYIMADGKHLWRIVDNLMNNICKYAQQGTRVYVNLEASGQSVHITFRNVSKYPLNISGEELMERFVRGDKSRNTEGHGLGLSIAQSLVKIIGGDMDITVDGDLFKVALAFDRYRPAVQEVITEKPDLNREIVEK